MKKPNVLILELELSYPQLDDTFTSSTLLYQIIHEETQILKNEMNQL